MNKRKMSYRGRKIVARQRKKRTGFAEFYDSLKPGGKIGVAVAIIGSFFAVVVGLTDLLTFVWDYYERESRVMTIRQERLPDVTRVTGDDLPASHEEIASSTLSLKFDDSFTNRYAYGVSEVFFDNNTGKTNRLMESRVTFNAIEEGTHYDVQVDATIFNNCLKIYVFNNGLAESGPINSTLYIAVENRSKWNQDEQRFETLEDIQFSISDVSNADASLVYETSSLQGGIITEAYSIDLDAQKVQDLIDSDYGTISVYLIVGGNTKSHLSQWEIDYPSEVEGKHHLGFIYMSASGEIELIKGGRGNLGDIKIYYWLDIANVLHTDYIIPMGHYPPIEDNEMVTFCIIPSSSAYVTYTLSFETEDGVLETGQFKEFIMLPLYGQGTELGVFSENIASCMAKNELTVYEYNSISEIQKEIGYNPYQLYEAFYATTIDGQSGERYFTNTERFQNVDI